MNNILGGPDAIILTLPGQYLKWNANDTWNRLALTNIAGNSGNSFTYKESGVIIGKNVKRVKAVGHFLFDCQSNMSSYIMGRIGKNNEGLAKGISAQIRWGTVHIEAIFEVKEGDKITLDVCKSAGDSNFGFYNYFDFGEGPGCYLIVEKIA